MRWTVTHGDILDVRADVLICSANVFLNLSGGVGGAILLRYGDAMQKELHGILASENRRFVEQGEVFETAGCGSFKAVLHAVAVDGFYQSRADVVSSIVKKSLAMAASLDARSVALTALATGYGRLTMRQFAEGIRPTVKMEFSPIEEVVICVRNDSDRAELISALELA